jgi:hypothetical protein
MNNSVDDACSSLCWGKKPNTRYAGVAGKGGHTTNYEIKERKED